MGLCNPEINSLVSQHPFDPRIYFSEYPQIFWSSGFLEIPFLDGLIIIQMAERTAFQNIPRHVLEYRSQLEHTCLLFVLLISL